MDGRKLYGVVCASICPMNQDGTIDYDGVKRLTRYLVDNGIHCLYPNGTNGESLSLTKEERFRIAETIAAENTGKAVLYIQCGASTVSESYELVRHAAKTGADGAGLMTPIFFPTDEEALRQYYDTILSSLPDFPMYIYNIPTRTGNDLSAKLLGALADAHGNLAGVKYSYPDILRLEHYADCCADRRLSVLIGNDSLAMACHTVGGSGWVSGPSAVFAAWHTAMYDALKAGKLSKAREIQYRIMRTADEMADIPEIPAIKYMLTRLGVIKSEMCRAPFRSLTGYEKARLDKIMSHI